MPRVTIPLPIALILTALCYCALSPARAQEPASGVALVTRQRVQLNLAGAELIVRESRKQAEAMQLKVNIAVVDDGGHLLAFARMDGARPGSGYTAQTKAVAAATFRTATGPVPAGTTAPDPILNLSLQNAAAASGGKVTSLFGGVPVTIDGQIAGAVGVGGATGEQDAQIARAGIEALVKAVSAPK
ncbi:MAG: heme-binding protein [Pirellulaceae bacterium]